MSADTRTPAAGRRRRILWIMTAFVTIAVVYVGVIALYAGSGQVSETEEEPPDVDVLLHIEPSAVQAASGRITLNIDLADAPDFESENGIGVDQTIKVLVTGAAGSRVIEFPADDVPSPVSVDLIADGVIEQWPFDTHTSLTTLLAYVETDDGPQALRTGAEAAGRVPGWNIQTREVDVAAEAEFDDGRRYPVPAIEITATRSGSTIAFGAVLLGLMIVMPVLVLSVAITVYRGRRRVEASFMSWMGAMLFATIPLRTFLPGSPPIGSWIDFLIVLWVIVGLIGGLAIYVAAWFRWSPRQDAH